MRKRRAPERAQRLQFPYSVTVVYSGNAYYGHSVSAPKTFTG